MYTKTVIPFDFLLCPDFHHVATPLPRSARSRKRSSNTTILPFNTLRCILAHAIRMVDSQRYN
jgi:hypothetical protein